MQALNAWAEVLAARPSQASAEQSLSLLIQTCRSIAGPGQAEAEPPSSPRKSIFSSLQAPSLFSHAARDAGGRCLVAVDYVIDVLPRFLYVTGNIRQRWLRCWSDGGRWLNVLTCLSAVLQRHSLLRQWLTVRRRSGQPCRCAATWCAPKVR